MATVQDAIDYAEQAVDGDIVVCKYVKQACERFIADLEREDWCYYFSVVEAQAILDFYGTFIRHVKGELRGQNIIVWREEGPRILAIRKHEEHEEDMLWCILCESFSPYHTV